MKYVWTSVALRIAGASVPQTPRTPLLSLFTSFQKLQNIRPSTSTFQYLQEQRRATSRLLARPPSHRLFATSSHLSFPHPRQRGKKRKPASSPEPERATTVASHTEGLPPGADGELTWRDYDPVGGMPLPDGELSQPEVNGIFGGEQVHADTGNYILSVMYWRRLSGALIDVGLEFPRDSGVKREQALRSLTYLRTLDPSFNEVEAGEIWAEEESQRLREELRARAVKLGLYKKLEPETEEEEAGDQGTEYGRHRTGESVLQTHRLEREAAHEKEQAEKAAAEEKAQTAALYSQRGPLDLSGGVQPPVSLQTYTTGGISIQEPQSKAWLQPVERKPWVKYYEEHAQVIKDNTVPQLSLLRRLGPSFIVMLAVVSLAVYVSENYTPAPAAARLFPETKPAVATLAGLSAALTLFFVLNRLPWLWRTFNKHFTLIPAKPHALAVVGSIFRHDTVSHLLANGIALWAFGLLLHDEVGRGTFLAIFFASGAVGGFASLTFNVLRKQWPVYMYGSSGAVLGIVAAVCALRPNTTAKVAGYEIPIALWVLLALYGSGEVIAVAWGLRMGIDHVGHLSGIAAGLVWGAYLRMKYAHEAGTSHLAKKVALRENEAQGGRSSQQS